MKKKLVMKKFLIWSLLRCCDFGFIRVFEWSIQKLKTDQCEQLCTYPSPKVRCWYWSKKDYHDLVGKCRRYTFFFFLKAPPEIQVACFYGADNLQEVLHDFTKEIEWENTSAVVKKCAKLAYGRNYKLFALGQSGLCLSGPNTSDKYYVSGTGWSYCRDGIGMGNSMFVYTLGKL